MHKRIPRLSNMAGLAIAAVFLMLLSGCGVTDSDNPDQFVVPFEVRVIATSTGSGLYTVTGGVIAATWDREEGVNSYTFVVIEADGSRGNEFSRALHQLERRGDKVSLVYAFGPTSIYIDISEAAKDAVIDKYNQALTPRLESLHKVEVTVNR